MIWLSSARHSFESWQEVADSPLSNLILIIPVKLKQPLTPLLSSTSSEVRGMSSHKAALQYCDRVSQIRSRPVL